MGVEEVVCFVWEEVSGWNFSDLVGVVAKTLPKSLKFCLSLTSSDTKHTTSSTPTPTHLPHHPTSPDMNR